MNVSQCWQRKLLGYEQRSATFHRQTLEGLQLDPDEGLSRKWDRCGDRFPESTQAFRMESSDSVSGLNHFVRKSLWSRLGQVLDLSLAAPLSLWKPCSWLHNIPGKASCQVRKAKSSVRFLSYGKTCRNILQINIGYKRETQSQKRPSSYNVYFCFRRRGI